MRAGAAGSLAFLWLAALTAAPADEGGVEVLVRPRTVYRRQSYTLEARLPAGLPAGARVAWEASGGTLITARGPRVRWRAPEAAGAVRIRARIEGGDPGLGREIEVPVREASPEGMVRVPAGVFTMGDTWTDTTDPRYTPTEQNKHDRPARKVHLDEFLIDCHKVTNRKFAAFLEAALAEGLVRVTPVGVLGEHEGSATYFYRFAFEEAPAPPKEIPVLEGEIRWDGGRLRIKDGCEEHPVVDVTWPGAAAFAAYHGKRLPTEAEWEKAARGTDGRRYPWGNALPTRHHANINRYYEGPTPVGRFSPLGDSPYGAADMLGGCHEWVQDWFNDDIFADHRPGVSGAPVRNPTGPDWGRDRVVRGLGRVDQSLATPQERSPLSFRYAWHFEFAFGDGFAHAHTGFRTALTP